ncbi:MAG: hypothetical protein CM15mP75_0290 [Flammeovirgaceae bacterium]|nr:MAG: hypothetical protein CM15mP75_0290 [Flammeovirgaceae bacterium]
MEDNKGNEREELYSQRVRAGKRTYFFDVRTTRGGDYYVTITESKKVFNDEGFYYQKHKIFLYKEDFNKFQDAMNATFNHVKDELLPMLISHSSIESMSQIPIQRINNKK